MNGVVIPEYGHQLYTECPKCKGFISIPPHYNPLTNLGYQCSGCYSRYIIVQCPSCKAQELLNSMEWNGLREEQAFRCKKCDNVAQLKSRSATLKLSPVRMGHTLSQWLGSASEEMFLEFAANTFPPQKVELVARVHGTVGTRINSAKEVVNKLREHKIITLEMYNTKNHHAPSGNQKIDAEDAVFRMSNALISGLEMIAQEVIVILDIDWPEHKVSFNNAIKQNKLIPHSSALHLMFQELQDSPEFKYLTKLRNCIHHRWSVPLVIESDFIVEVPGSIEEDHFPSSHEVFLPDDPSLPVNKITYDERRELLATFETQITKIEEFADGVYQALYLALQGR